MGDRPRRHEVVECREHLGVVEEVGRRTVQLDEVEGLHLQVLAAAIRPGDDVLRRVALDALGRQAPAGLRRHEDRRSELLTQLGNQAFAPPVPVDVGRVEEVHTALGRRPQCRQGGVVVGFPQSAPIAQAPKPMTLASHPVFPSRRVSMCLTIGASETSSSRSPGARRSGRAPGVRSLQVLFEPLRNWPELLLALCSSRPSRPWPAGNRQARCTTAARGIRRKTSGRVSRASPSPV